MNTEQILRRALLAIAAAGFVLLPPPLGAAPLSDGETKAQDGTTVETERQKVTVEGEEVDEGRDDDDDGGSALLSISLGESVYFREDVAFRGPVSLSITPSFGWEWVKLDLGLFTTLEDLEDAPYALVLRPGVRFTPPIHLYARFAVPIQLASEFDYGFLFGVGGDIPLDDDFGLFVEANTFLTDDSEWSKTWPLEFQLGVRFFFG